MQGDGFGWAGSFDRGVLTWDGLPAGSHRVVWDGRSMDVVLETGKTHVLTWSLP